MQTFAYGYCAAFACELRVPLAAHVPAALDARTVIARRALTALPPNNGEIAPGIDIERDIFAQMGLRPVVSAELKLDARISAPESMGWRTDMLALPFAERLTFDSRKELFFVNFEGVEIDSLADIDTIHRLLQARLAPLGRKVPAIINDDNFTIAPALLDA